jgi:ABC-type antimicrobial peptide transport system permease subunit
VLLLLVVALSATLVCAVATAMASVTESLRARMIGAVGASDLRVIVPGSARPLDESLIRRIKGWNEVADASGRLRAAAALRAVRPTWPETEEAGAKVWKRAVRSSGVTAYVESFRPGFDETRHPVEIEEGRTPGAEGEIAIDRTVLDRLRGIAPQTDRRSGTLSALISGTVSAVPEGRAEEAQDLGPAQAAGAEEAKRLTESHEVRLGDTIEFLRASRPALKLKIVGIGPRGVLGGRPRAWMTPEALASATDQVGRYTEIEIALKPGQNPETVAGARKGDVPEPALLQSTAKVTSNLESSLKANQVGLIVASSLAFLSAAFIILTGMTTGVVERQRELAILRCIGASRFQIGASQLISGLLVGVSGSVLGVPLGVGLASLVIWWFKEDLKVQLAFPVAGIAAGLIGSVLAGLVGAAFPAWRAASMQPLKALGARAESPRASSVRWTLVIGLVLIAIHFCVVTFAANADLLFWMYILMGLPAMFIGYFVLSVPITAGVVRFAGAPIALLLGVPRTLLERSIRRTPYRHGFTAGALMAGLAMMVALWTQGTALARDWVAKIQFPDAFVTGIALSDEAVRKLESMPGITGASPLSLVRVETSGMGVNSLREIKAAFIGFNPDSFFRLMDVTWVQGDRQIAVRRLNEGGAIIVAREFLTSKGLGVGSRLRISYQNHSAEFEIVGVVTSPGLDIVSNFFDLGDMYVDQAVGAVFGSRRDLSEKLLAGGSPPTQLISLTLAKNADDAEVASRIRTELFDYGVLDVGTGRFLKQLIQAAIGRGQYIVSGIAFMSMIVACLGVANLIIAAIEGRQFEFGVLRAVGASRGVVCRLVLAEAVVVALGASIVGTLMGIQGSYGGVRLNAVIMGVQLTLRPPLLPIAAGWGIVLALALLAAAPAVIALSRREPRKLLAATKG